MKKKNVPKIINFDENPLSLNFKEDDVKKKKSKKRKKTPSKKRVLNLQKENVKKENNKKKVDNLIEYHDLSKRVEVDKLSFNKVDYCTMSPILVEEKQKDLPIKKDKKVKPIQKLEEKKEVNKKQPVIEEESYIEPEVVEEITSVKDPLNQNTYNGDENNILLEVVNLRKQYNRKAKPAIDKLNFQVLRGQFHAFIGANGAGKTTTIKSIVGAYANFEGQVKISGLDNREKMSKARLGYIPEIARFPSRISAFNYLKSMAMLNRLTSKEAENFAKDILIEFKMYDLKDVSPNKFSSGQKKKILLGQALSNDPDILIMDEPAANLDPKARIDFFNILKGLQRRGKSIFISSHILSELDLYADSLTILDGGKIAYTGIRHDESHHGNKYAYRIHLLKENDFGKYNMSKITFEQNVDEPKQYIVSSNDKNAIDDLLAYLFKNNKTNKVELYRLSIEDMYKKYVIFGSVHTGYKLNVNSTLEENTK